MFKRVLCSATSNQLLIVILIVIGIVDAERKRYGCCAKYGLNDVMPINSRYHRFCLKENDGSYYYCKEWRCPRLPAPCNKSLYEGPCEHCSGTCMQGGRIFKPTSPFVSVDGTNACFCTSNGTTPCTYGPQRHRDMCKSEKGCKGYRFIRMYYGK